MSVDNDASIKTVLVLEKRLLNPSPVPVVEGHPIGFQAL